MDIGRRYITGRRAAERVGIDINDEFRVGPRVGDWSIGEAAPIPNRGATAVPIGETVVATGRRNGF